MQGKVLSARGLRRGLLVTTLVLGVALFAGSSAADHGPESHTLTISDPTAVFEGDSGTVNVSFDVTLSLATTEPVTVDFATADNTAQAPGDYASVPTTTLTFPAATLELTQSVTVQVQGDAIDELNETFFGNLTNASANASIADGQGIATITDDEPTPTVAIADASGNEGGDVVFNVTLSGPSSTAVTATYTGSADPGSADPGDLSGVLTGTVTFPANSNATQQVAFATAEDAIDEPNETFTVTLSNVSPNAILGDSSATGMIADDDSAPTISITDDTADEGTSASFTVSLTNPSSAQVTATYTASADPGTADPADLSGGLTGTVTFPASSNADQTVAIGTFGDVIDEPNETFTVTLSNVSTNATPGDVSATGTIVDDDGQPTISITDDTADEGTPASFTVLLSNPSSNQVTVNFATTHGSTSPQDFSNLGQLAGTVTFPAGSAAPQSITIGTFEDAIDEPNETFTVTLSNASANAAIAPGSGVATGTITDDDATPSVSIGNAAAIAEGGTVTFPVTLSASSGQTVTVSYSTTHVSSSAGDFTGSLNGTVAFPPGDTSEPIEIQTNDDLLDEADPETFTVTISAPSNATLGNSSGSGAINDNDALPTVSIANAPVVFEGAVVSFPVTLSPASGRPVTVSYLTTHGTTAAADLSGALTGTVTFAPGDPLTKQITIATVDDTVDEPAAETFNITLSTPTNVSIPPGQGTATGTINDNDDPPSLSISDGNALEGNSGLPNCGSVPAPGTTPTGFAFFTVSLSAASGLPVTVQWSTADNTAVSPDDYASVSPTTLTFLPGALSQPVCVRIAGDVSDEPNQTLNVLLTAPTNATINDGTGVGTILDDDGAPALTVTGANDPEGGGPARFVVSLLPASGNTVTVNVGTAGGSAVAGTDFAPIPAGVSPSPPNTCSANPCGLTFTPGQTSKAIDINIVDDPLDENDETFTVSLSNEQNAVILNGNDRFGIVTIVDNDAPPSVSIGDVTVAEGHSGTVGASFPVILSAASAKTVSVNFAPANGSAVAPEDFAASGGTVTFSPGETSKIAVVPVNGDTSVEPDEAFSVALSSPVNVTIADGQAVGKIVNDDDSPPPPPPPPPPTGPPPPPPTTTTPGPTTTSSTSTGPTTSAPPRPRTFSGMGVSAKPVTLLDNLAPIRVTCSRRASGACIGRVVLQGQARVLAIVRGQPFAKAVTLGREAFAIQRGRSEKVLVGLTKRAVRAVKRAGKLRVTVVVTARDSAGKRATTIRRALWLRAPKAPKRR